MELLTADETTSDSGASTTSSSPPAPQDVDMSLLQVVARRKKRKPTYYARKDEAEALKADMEELQRRLDELMTAKEEAENEALVQSMATNAELHLSVRQHATTMAGVQGMLAAHQASGAPFPLESFIHLTTNLEQRRRTLLSLRDQKLRDGLEYMIERTRPLDLSKTQCKKEASYTPEGFYTFHQFDATVFPGAQSVRHAYDVLRDFFRYQEISISEILGLISIRESDNCEDEPVLQCRMVTTLSNGLDVENNGAMFFSYFGHSDVLDAPYGIFIQETIDRDDMFPYQTDIRARLRLTAIVLLTQTPGTESSPSGSISVTMTRATFGCFHLPSDLVGNVAVEGPAQAFADHVGGVMIQVLRERLGSAQP